LRNVPIAITDPGAAIAWGTAVIGDFPEGNIKYQGCVGYVTLDENGDAGISDTFNSDFAVGTAPTADATLAGAEVDLIAETAIAAATAGVTPRTRATGAAEDGIYFDNTDGSLEINLQVLIDDADISASGNILADVDLTISYIVMDDD